MMDPFRRDEGVHDADKSSNSPHKSSWEEFIRLIKLPLEEKIVEYTYGSVKSFTLKKWHCC